MLIRSLCAVVIAISFLPGSFAHAAEKEMVIPAAQRVDRPVLFPGAGGNRETVVYGPVEVSASVRKTKGIIYAYLEGATFGGHAGSVEFYLVFPPKGPAKPNAPLRVDAGDYVGAFAAMEDGHTEPMTRIEEVNNFDVKGAPFRPRTHLQKAAQVYWAVVEPTPHFKFDRVVITTTPPSERAAAAPACDARVFHQWEVGKLAENCLQPKACVTDERLADLSCGGKADPEACMSRCITTGLEMIGRAFYSAPPDQSACIGCLSRGYARYVAKCGAVCPACPRDAGAEKRCDDCLAGENVFAACVPP